MHSRAARLCVPGGEAPLGPPSPVGCVGCGAKNGCVPAADANGVAAAGTNGGAASTEYGSGRGRGRVCAYEYASSHGAYGATNAPPKEVMAPK